MVKKWEVLKSDYVLTTKWLTVRKDKVRLPSGYVADDFYVLEYPDWVNVIAITKEGKFLVERQYRHGAQAVVYELCAGTLEKGEDPLKGAKRELLEETGYAGGEWELFCISSPNSAAMTNDCYSFVARGVEFTGARHLEQTEDIEILLMSYNELKELVKAGGIKEGQMLSALWKYIAENQ